MNDDDVARLVTALRDGDESAFHTLLEAPSSVVPVLVEQYKICSAVESRAQIVEVIWQHRQRSTVGFLAAALEDAHAEVWKQALDGLVTIGGPEGQAALETFLVDHAEDERASWVKEAIEQLRN